MDLQTFRENVERKMNAANAATKPAPRLTPEAIAAVERTIAKDGRRAEVTYTEKNGVRVVELTHKAAYREDTKRNRS